MGFRTSSCRTSTASRSARGWRRRGRLTVPQTVSVMKDVARALAYAHERGVVHRDIKPAQHPPRRRRGDRHRLRCRQGAEQRAAQRWRWAPRHAHRRRHLARHATVHGARAGRGGSRCRSPSGHLRVRRHGVRDARRTTALRRPGAARADGRAHDGGSAARVQHSGPTCRRSLADFVMRCLERDPVDRPQTATELLAALDDPAMVSGAFGVPASDIGRWRRWRDRSDHRCTWRRCSSQPPSRPRPSCSVSRRRARAPLRRRPPHRTGPHAMVVLPLVSIGGDSANAYLADGITNELASALSRVPGVQVVSPSRAATMLAAGRTPADVGRELGVDAPARGHRAAGGETTARHGAPRRRPGRRR